MILRVIDPRSLFVDLHKVVVYVLAERLLPEFSGKQTHNLFLKVQ